VNHGIQWYFTNLVEIGKSLPDIDPVTAISWKFYLGELN